MFKNPREFLLENNNYLSKAALLRLGVEMGYEHHLTIGQLENGNWNNSVYDTIEILYRDSLFNQELNTSIERAINWLLQRDLEPMKYQNSDGCSYDYLLFKTSKEDNQKFRKMKTVPFTNGCSGFVKTGATLYLTSHYGMQDEYTSRIFETISKLPECRRHGWYCSSVCGNNIFQAVCNDPFYSKKDSVNIALNYLSSNQRDDGYFENRLPFFPIVNALSRLENPRAYEIFELCLERAKKIQHKDGSWGKSHKNINTYLMIDALVRKGIEI